MKIKKAIAWIILTILILIGIALMAPAAAFLYLCRTPKHTVDEVKWLPPTAQVLFFADNHGGFHGDGITYLTFTATPVNIATLINSFYKNHRMSWETNQLDSTAIQTVDGAAYKLKVPFEMKPDTTSTDYIIGHREAFQGLYYDLIILDTNKNQLWYLNFTT